MYDSVKKKLSRQLMYGAGPTENKLKIFVLSDSTLVLQWSIVRNAK